MVINYIGSLILSAPSDNIWDIDSGHADRTLLTQNWNTIKQNRVGIAMFWTIDPLRRTQPEPARPAGATLAGQGIVISYAGSLSSDKVLAHELGHYAGYEGHSSDPANMMSQGEGTTPDENWCADVFALAE